MKRETKELIDWIKERIFVSLKNHEEDYLKAAEEVQAAEAERFLDSLPELEERLKHGGFIPDRNGTPCKDGDRIRVFFSDGSCVESTLQWISEPFGFQYEYDFEEDGLQGLLLYEGEFEKVVEEDE